MGAVGAPIEFWKVKGFAERQTHSAATRGTLPAGPGFIGTLDANRNHRHSGLEDQSQDSDAERLQTPIPGTLAFREDHYRGAVVEATQHGSRGLRSEERRVGKEWRCRRWASRASKHRREGQA